jgi:hypothetical protein
VVAPCHQINDSTAAVAAFPSILSRDIVQDLRSRVLGAVADMSGRLADGAGLRAAHETTADLVLNILWRDELAALGDVAVGSIGCFHLHLAFLELAYELIGEEKAVLFGGDGLAAAAWREQRLVGQRQRE